MIFEFECLLGGLRPGAPFGRAAWLKRQMAGRIWSGDGALFRMRTARNALSNVQLI